MCLIFLWIHHRGVGLLDGKDVTNLDVRSSNDVTTRLWTLLNSDPFR